MEQEEDAFSLYKNKVSALFKLVPYDREMVVNYLDNLEGDEVCYVVFE